MARRLNTDNSTNATLAIMAAIEVLEKLTQHPLPPDTKVTVIEICVAVGLWFTGKPSAETLSIAKLLGGKNGLDSGVSLGDTAGECSDPVLGRGMVADGAEGRRGGLGAPVLDEAARVAQYWESRPAAPVVGSPTIEGLGMSAVEFAARSMAGDEQSGVFRGQ